MPTIDELTKTALTISNKANISGLMSAELYALIGDAVTLEEITAKQIRLNWSTKVLGNGANDLQGLIFVNPTRIYLRGTTDGNNPALPEGSVDVRGLTQLQWLRSTQISSIPFSGDISNYTTLTNIELHMNTLGQNLIIPNLSNCPELVSVNLTGGTGTYTLAQFGNLSGLRKLQTFILSNQNIGTSIVDNILSTLLEAKNAGCPLATVNLASCQAPTGGNSNASRLALIAAGVSVITRA